MMTSDDCPGVYAFDTVTTGTMIPHGNGTDGAVVFVFHTADGTILHTTIGPILARQFVSQICQALNGSPNPDFAEPTHARDIPGKGQKTAKSVTYFNQEYPPEILQALGVLIVRVNLVERGMIRLLAALMDSAEPMAEALFYSTSNNRARIDLIASLIPHADLTDHEPEQIQRTLDDLAGLARRRNNLIHGHWEFRGAKFNVHTYEPSGKGKKSQVPVVTEKSILQIAADFRTQGMVLEGFAATLANRNIARKAAATHASLSSQGLRRHST